MIIKDLSIILKSMDYKDNDELLYVLSKQHGLITLVNKGSKKITSKRKLMPYMICNTIYDYKEGKNIFNLTQYELIDSFKQIESIELLSLLNVICEITYHYLLSNEFINPFDDLKYLIQNINLNNYYTLGAIYIATLANNSGIGAEVNHCVLCQNTYVVDIDIAKGGFICEKHANRKSDFDTLTLKKFRLANKLKIEDYEYLNNYHFDSRDFNLILDFYLYHSGLNQRLFSFLKTLI